MNPTEEQLQVINSTSKLIKVIAFAGAAKSTTLEMYAQARPNARILLVCFNKANQLEAEKKFPANVTSMTSHALGMRSIGIKYRHKLVADLRINDVASLYNTQYQVSNGIISTLKRYLVSDSEKLNASHLDLDICKNPIHHSFILQKAELLWAAMCDPESSVGMLHDGYLKLYQLSKPKLDSQYDIILFEEAQDSNPVTTSIIKMQTECGLVVVGDPHQSIYSFRGASNSLDKFDVDEIFYLTKSFRFGQGIANVANALLQYFKNEKNKVVGAGKFPETAFNIDATRYHAIISRTNAALFDEAVNVITSNRIPHFVGGVKGYRMNDILDAYYLFAGDNFKIKGHLKAHSNWTQFDQYTEESSDPECLILRKIVLAYTHQIPSLVDEIMRKSVDDVNKAHVTLTTAHKSKGLEFDQVLLTDDYPELIVDGKMNPELSFEDVNLLYVAVTRAERAIRLNDSTRQFLHFIGADVIANADEPTTVAEPELEKQSLWLTQALESALKRDLNNVISDVEKLLVILKRKRAEAEN
jgi:hypothetical protein